MNEYKVVWQIDIDADSPEEAASKALIIQRDNDPANTATIFDVYDGDGHRTEVDLNED